MTRDKRGLELNPGDPVAWPRTVNGVSVLGLGWLAEVEGGKALVDTRRAEGTRWFRVPVSIVVKLARA